MSRLWGIAGMDLTCRVSFQCTSNNSCGILNMVTKCEKLCALQKKRGFISLVIKKKKINQTNLSGVVADCIRKRIGSVKFWIYEL